MPNPPPRRSRFTRAANQLDTLEEGEKLTPEARELQALDGAFKASSSPATDADAYAQSDAVAAVTQEIEGWRARWVLAEQDGRPVARSVTLEPTTQRTPSGGVTSNLLRELSPSGAVEVAAQMLDQTPSDDWPMGLSVRWRREDVAELEAPDLEPARPGRPRLSDDLLRRVAIGYLEQQRHGRGVLRRLAADFERPESTLRDWVRQARIRGWLGPAPKQGRGGGGPGPLLLEDSGGTEADRSEA